MQYNIILTIELQKFILTSEEYITEKDKKKILEIIDKYEKNKEKNQIPHTVITNSILKENNPFAISVALNIKNEIEKEINKKFDFSPIEIELYL